MVGLRSITSRVVPMILSVPMAVVIQRQKREHVRFNTSTRHFLSAFLIFQISHNLTDQHAQEEEEAEEEEAAEEKEEAAEERACKV